MATKLINVRKIAGDWEAFMFRLLEERTPDQSISHVAMPTAEQHLEFCKRPPYRAWYIISDDEGPGAWVGACYITSRNEIGVSILKDFQRQGHGAAAVKKLISMWGRSLAGKPVNGNMEVYANVNPLNTASVDMFVKCGFDLRQVTLALPVAQATPRPLPPVEVA